MAYSYPSLDLRVTFVSELSQASQDPALKPMLGQPPAALLPRFASYHDCLTRLPRRARRSLQRQWKRSLSALALLLALGQAPALAAAIDVTTNVPGINADGNCSLIEAIVNANDDAQTHIDCAAGDAGADTIDFVGAGVGTHTLMTVNTNFHGDTGVPVVSSAITIEGHGSTITRDSGAPPFRILAVSSTGNLTVNETTVSGGAATGLSGNGNGGGIANNGGTVTLTNSTVSGNSAGSNGSVLLAHHNNGGGIANNGGTVTLTNSTVSGNSARGNDGGVNNDLAP